MRELKVGDLRMTDAHTVYVVLNLSTTKVKLLVVSSKSMFPNDKVRIIQWEMYDCAGDALISRGV